MDVSLGNVNNNNQESTGKMTLEQNTQDDESSCLDIKEPKIESKSGPFDKHSSTSGNTNNNCFSDKTVGQMSARLAQQNLSSTKGKGRAETVNVTAALTSHPEPALSTHVGNKPLSSILSQEHRQRAKKFSHPIFMPFNASSTVNVDGGSLHTPTTSAALFSNQYKVPSPKFSRNVIPSHAISLGAPSSGGSRSPVMRRLKKHSMPVVPILSLNDADGDDEDDVTKRLETAVRRISRGSPNRQGYAGNSPLIGRTSPNRFVCSPQEESPVGLSGLARGYEQYREWLTTLRPTTEFGEASSDDLSSEWESSAELELVRAYGSIMTLKNSVSLVSNVPSSPSGQNNVHPAVRRRRSAEERKKEMQKKGHYRRPADDAIDDDEDYDIKKKDCAVCMGDTIQESEAISNKSEDVRQEFLHHKQHSMKRVC